MGLGPGYNNKWTRISVIKALIEFYKLNHRFPRADENYGLYFGCRNLFGSGTKAREIAMGKMRQNGEKIEIPCRIELDDFWTKCYHARNCYLSDHCPIAVHGSGNGQFCGSPIGGPDFVHVPEDFRRGERQ